MNRHERGAVVWHPAPFRDGGRPFVVLIDDDHPFYGEEYVVVGVTTTERERAVALTPETSAEGGAPKPSWASPWYVLTVKHATITDRLGRLTAETTDEIATALARPVGVDTRRG
ncbi:MAG: type II toxin-antitoxin system PemK/MazF family toxin [Haloarculaceae archaeon]